MYFTVIGTGEQPPADARNQAYLIPDDWNDWNKFTTQYTLIVCDAAGVQHPIGDVKIGQFDMKQDQQRAEIPSTFDALGPQFFSLGQDYTYYERLKERKHIIRDRVLTGLRDIAADENLFERAKNEVVTTQSLLRSVTGVTAQEQFRRLARGGERLRSYKFRYTGPMPAGEHQQDAKPVVLTFEVVPSSNPPLNIHVLIGPNGVGKTRILEHMARALIDGPDSSAVNGVFERMGNADTDDFFANIVSVTFSAFDPFDPLPDRRGETDGIRYSYVGLKSTSKIATVKGTPKNLNTLTMDFAKSLERCATSSKAERWREALRTLESDPIFREANVSSLIDGFGDEEESGIDSKRAADKLADDATSLFLNLSTGHKIVLLTITRLVETVEERTLVLFDEPESHLHPPLLSAFIRAFSNLLISRNGVAVIATHSPVVLQEVPKSCSWKLQRYGNIVEAERPESETFGENIGALTREVFGLEVTDSGFHALLREAVEKGGDYEKILGQFSKKLGAEARALLRTLLATRNDNNGE